MEEIAMYNLTRATYQFWRADLLSIDQELVKVGSYVFNPGLNVMHS